MSFKLDHGLSPQPSVIELADFWELECLRRADFTASVIDISKIIGIADDIAEEDQDEFDFVHESILSDVQSEICRRQKACAGRYPFIFQKGSSLGLNASMTAPETITYMFLLLATRQNMRGLNRIAEGIDGTKIFEKIAANALSGYIGQNSKSVVFGTAESDGFSAKLSALVRDLSEGTIHETPNLSYNPKDDKLDVVAWVPFSDGQASKLICFGQCKTGTSWVDHITQLNVSRFLKNWFSREPALSPVPAFLISDIVSPSDFFHRSTTYLFLDRCRIFEFTRNSKEQEWYGEMAKWSCAILSIYNYNVKSEWVQEFESNL
ncbi:MAG: hypothetical protein K9J06_11530 [Flavobacteriales bacterium]|nr:hypothetical protein [Flavobacteriales bacterium]